MRILIVQNEAESHAGVVGEALRAEGGTLEVRRTYAGDPIPDSPADHDGLLLLGGEQSAIDDRHAFMPPLFALIRRFDDEAKPVLGICLGAQMIARAFGARVYRHREVEFGFTPMRVTEHAAADPLLGALPAPPVMQWHEDTFDLPEGALLLATGDRCHHQAYRVGRATWAFQGHIEVDGSILHDWARMPGARDAAGGRDPVALLESEMPLHLDAASDLGRAVGSRWGRLVEAARRRQGARG
jgi:GMP synthase-like glutamine amidotransferase